jgi:alpha/beta hydrolase fold
MASYTFRRRWRKHLGKGKERIMCMNCKCNEAYPLRDEAGTFAARLTGAGVPVTFRMVAGVNHGFMGAPQPLTAVKETLSFVAHWMATL